MILPSRIFFTGVPGSRWSGLAQKIEQELNLNISDRTPARTYAHGEFTGHQGAYFGTGMEFPAKLDTATLDAPYADQGPGKLHKSHEWAYMLDAITELYPQDPIFLIYRPTKSSFDWWKQAGGWDISYPDYKWYIDDETMIRKIDEQNQLILKFASQKQLVWSHVNDFTDILIAYYIPVVNSD